MRRDVGGLAAVLLLVACAPQLGAQQAACRPVPKPTLAQPLAQPEQLAGEYTLTLVSRWYEDAGKRVTGRLSLWVPDTLYRYYTRRLLRATSDSLRWERHGGDLALAGATDVPLAAVHAPAMGDPRSRDPLQPGVRWDGKAFVVTPEPLGYFTEDGYYTYLEPQSVDADGFRGVWRAEYGLVQQVRNGQPVRAPDGYFCAVRRHRRPSPR